MLVLIKFIRPFLVSRHTPGIGWASREGLNRSWRISLTIGA